MQMELLIRVHHREYAGHGSMPDENNINAFILLFKLKPRKGAGLS